MAPFTPKYVLGKENHRTQFDVQLLFGDAMDSGKEYTEEELMDSVGLLSNIATEKILKEQIDKALKQGIIMQSYNGFQKRIYVRPKPAPSTVVQPTLF